MRVAGFEIVVDPRVAPDEIEFRPRQIVVSRITNLRWETFMSTTYKSLAAGFALGVISTGVYALGIHVVGAILWGGSLVYVGYKYYEARKGES